MPLDGKSASENRRPTYGERMFGYIIVCVIGLVLLALLLVGLAKGPAHSKDSGRLPGPAPVQPNAPGADEPTPDRSATALPKQVRTAREHTPPA